MQASVLGEGLLLMERPQAQRQTCSLPLHRVHHSHCFHALSSLANVAQDRHLVLLLLHTHFPGISNFFLFQQTILIGWLHHAQTGSLALPIPLRL